MAMFQKALGSDYEPLKSGEDLKHLHALRRILTDVCWGQSDGHLNIQEIIEREYERMKENIGTIDLLIETLQKERQILLDDVQKCDEIFNNNKDMFNNVQQ
ncbi:MAG: hypothetical protein ACRCS8_00570 [Brevinema sp.]